jgi:hypothetical protein
LPWQALLMQTSPSVWLQTWQAVPPIPQKAFVVPAWQTPLGPAVQHPFGQLPGVHRPASGTLASTGDVTPASLLPPVPPVEPPPPPVGDLPPLVWTGGFVVSSDEQAPTTPAQTSMPAVTRARTFMREA